MTIETFGRFCRPVNFFIPENENINSTAAALLDVGFAVPMAGFASFGICRTFTDGRFGMRRIDVTGIVPLVAHFTGFRPAAFFCARYLRRNGNPTNQDQDGNKDKPQEFSLHRPPPLQLCTKLALSFFMAGRKPETNSNKHHPGNTNLLISA